MHCFERFGVRTQNEHERMCMVLLLLLFSFIFRLFIVYFRMQALGTLLRYLSVDKCSFKTYGLFFLCVLKVF